jgi:hypothetical protein
LQVAADDPEHVVLTVYSEQGPSSICPGAAAYLSADGGETWNVVARRALPPLGNSHIVCELWVTAQHLYFWFWSSSSDPRGIQVTLLERSDDGGQTWMRADNGFGSYSITVQAGSGDTMLVAATPASDPAASVTLWVTLDAGRTWRRVGPMPQYSRWILASQEPGITSPTAGPALYSLVGDQIPAAQFRLRALQTTDGRRWTALPPLPVPGASAGRLGISNPLGVDASGRFLAFGVDPVAGVPVDDGSGSAVFDKGQWLWAWDPHTQRWAVAAVPLPRPWPRCSELCWLAAFSWGAEPGRSGNGTFLWVSGWTADGGLYRIFLPAA